MMMLPGWSSKHLVAAWLGEKVAGIHLTKWLLEKVSESVLFEEIMWRTRWSCGCRACFFEHGLSMSWEKSNSPIILRRFLGYDNLQEDIFMSVTRAVNLGKCDNVKGRVWWYLKCSNNVVTIHHQSPNKSLVYDLCSFTWDIIPNSSYL